MRIRNGKNSDPGWKKVGSRINIPDPQHWQFCILGEGSLFVGVVPAVPLLLQLVHPLDVVLTHLVVVQRILITEKMLATIQGSDADR
jgi:hypothetical protein